MPEILEDAENGLPGLTRELFSRLLGHFCELDRQVKELEAQITLWHRRSATSRRLEAIPGIGPLTASALVASVGDEIIQKRSATRGMGARRGTLWKGEQLLEF